MVKKKKLEIKEMPINFTIIKINPFPMPLNKMLRILILAILAIGLVLVIFFLITISFSEPVNNPPVYGQGKKAASEDYTNCLIVYSNQVVLITAGSRDTLTSEQIVPSIQKKRESVSKGTFNIITTPDTNFGMVVKALDACTISELKEYQLLEL
jgi:biopolymer transport protein ExbD